MALTITTAATNTNLCMLEDMPTGIRGASNANDYELSRLIVRASALMKRYCRRYFEAQTYTETVATFGGNILQLGRTKAGAGLFAGGPITTLTSVTDIRDSSTVTGPTIHDPTAMQLYYTNGWGWSAYADTGLLSNVIPGNEREVYQVVYVAGYALPANSVTSDLPEDLRFACVEAVTRMWHRLERDPDIGQINIPGDVAITYRAQQAQGRAQQILGGEVTEYLDNAWTVWEFV